MKTRLAILLCVLIGAGALFNQSAQALSFVIESGDKPYYEGHRDFWDWGWYYVWVPGHWVTVHHQKVWVHGYYIRKGDWNGKYVKNRHNWHKHHDHNRH